jgi:hypothetical protein
MAKKKLFFIKESLFFCFNNPILFLISLIFFAISYYLSIAFNEIIKQTTNLTLLKILPFFYSILFFALLAFFFSGMMGIVLSKLEKSKNNFIYYSKKYTLKNLALFLIGWLFFVVVLLLSSAISLFIGKSFNLNINEATIVYIFFMVFFILLGPIIMIYTNGIILLGEGFFKSIKRGANLVYSNYAISCLFVLFLGAGYYLIQKYIGGIYDDLILSVLIPPFIASYIIHFVKRR